MQITKQAWLNSNHLFTKAVQQQLNAMELPMVASTAKKAQPPRSTTWTFRWQEMALVAREDSLGMIVISLPDEV